LSTPPREGFRAVLPATLEVRDKPKNEGNGRTLSGHFAVFNRWTEIDSMWEGHFLERVAPGAFKKTFSEMTPKVLFQHGRDAVVGDRPLGTITALREDGDKGAYYEVDLFDTSYNNDLIPGLRAGVYGASFRFRATREEFEERPERSDFNPDGLPQRTIKEAQVSEFGPVTFPAYADATAGVRSLTDDLFLRSAAADPERFARFVGGQDDLLRAIVEMAQKSKTVIDLGSKSEKVLSPEDTRALEEKLEPTEKPVEEGKPEIFSIRQILDAGFSPETAVMIVEDSARENQDDLEENAPVEDAAPEGTSETRRVEDAPATAIPPVVRREDPEFITIGSLKPIPRMKKGA
jgi:HK97 family phage prohead protease